MIEFNKSLSLIELFIYVTAASKGVTHTNSSIATPRSVHGYHIMYGH